MSVVDPRNYLPHLITWSTFNLFSVFANILLVIVTFISQGSEANFLLIHLELIFVLTSGAASLLIWTGHALDMYPPHTLCLANAFLAMANPPLQGGAAFAIVLRVWGSVMAACRPQWMPAIRWTVSGPFVCRLSWLFFHVGLDNPTKVYRGSPFYCTVDHRKLQDACSGFGACFTFLALLFSGWTAYNLFTTRWRVRRVVEYPGVSYAFVIRTLVFSIFLGIAFVVGIISLRSSFSAIVPDVTLSSCNVGVFFIFATSEPILEFVFGCRCSRRAIPPLPMDSSPSGHFGSGRTDTPDTPQELVTFPVVALGVERHPIWHFTANYVEQGKSNEVIDSV
ncbi:hypothetical protein R3P38DRAFT_2874012 [Favolaschia claudopus]|uniref:Uncharacterized protein n=1 Tax=Favolaschia claudopus TaxID=2862362 RepID=A0AAW0D5X5_9AGAR